MQPFILLLFVVFASALVKRYNSNDEPLKSGRRLNFPNTTNPFALDYLEVTAHFPTNADLISTKTGGGDIDKFVTTIDVTNAAIAGKNVINVDGSNMLENQIICGYQGWFGFPGDGAQINRWKHWFRSSSSTTYQSLTVDMYPTTDEYDNADLKESEVIMPDGSYAKFFSSVRPNVVLKHFEWMATYGITGVFHHRFLLDLHNSNVRETRTMVLRNVRRAAEATDRKFAVSYDIAGCNNDVMERLKIDWMTLVDVERVTESSNYILQNGLPVLHLWGIGFEHIDVTDASGMNSLIKWLQSDAPLQYRVFVVGGVPGAWRTQGGNTRKGKEWKSIFDSLDGLQPWHVGVFNNAIQFDSYFSDTIVNDALYCKQIGILYMPTMFPGFSWYNLKKGATAINKIPRDGGRFMWRQAYRYISDPIINTLYLAQFDEVDEGTAIFKVTAKTSDLPLPTGGWLALDADGYSLPSDWYLRLTGEAQLMLEGRVPITATIPIDPNNPYRNESTSSNPSETPSVNPSVNPSDTPTATPSSAPTYLPTTFKPSSSPSSYPSETPSVHPSAYPSDTPTATPSSAPTNLPTTLKPSSSPTSKPTSSKPTSSKPTSSKPTTSRPSSSPTFKPTTLKPSSSPTFKPKTSRPMSSKPTSSTPTSSSPTFKTTTLKPSSSPTFKPKTSRPSSKSTSKPTSKPTTSKPTTSTPSSGPTFKPTTSRLISSPTFKPTTLKPSTSPTFKPTSSKPMSSKPTTSKPSSSPTFKPTTLKPSSSPTT